MGNCINSSMSKIIYHQQLGHMEMQYGDNYAVEYFKTTLKLNSKQKYDKWASQIKRMRFNPETQDFLYLPLKIGLKDQDLFQNETLIQIFYQPFIETLQDLLQRYQLNSMYPTQELAWYLIYSLIKVGKYFEKINSKIGAIKPSNIVITLKRQFKIIGELSSLDFMSPIDQVKLKLSDKPLLAPQQIQFLNNNRNSSLAEQFNVQTSEVFSIGVLVLCMINLFEPHKIYNYHNDLEDSFSIDFRKIQTLLQRTRKNKRLSDKLIQTISQMLEPNPQKRIKSSQIFKRQSQFKNEILNNRGLNYSGQQIQKIKESINGSFANRTLNNSMQTNGNKSFNNNTVSFRVSQISLGQEKLSHDEKDHRFNRKIFHQNKDFLNIL